MSTVDEAPLAPEVSLPDPEKEPELHWLRTTYKPGARQLTVRAVLAGMVIGAVMCLSNLYVVLKTGWSLGVTVTACILAFAVFRFGEDRALTARFDVFFSRSGSLERLGC